MKKFDKLFFACIIAVSLTFAYFVVNRRCKNSNCYNHNIEIRPLSIIAEPPVISNNNQSPPVWKIECPQRVSGAFNHSFLINGIRQGIHGPFELSFPDVANGGIWTPKECTPVHKWISVILAVREPKLDLKTHIFIIHSYLRQQKVPHVIVTVQLKEKVNKGLMYNIGMLASPRWINCFILMDVNMMPDRLDNTFQCDQEKPTSMFYRVSIGTNQSVTWFSRFCGVYAFTREQYYKVNGFSTLFWEMGGEDEDMSSRIRKYYGGMKKVSEEVGDMTYIGDWKEGDGYKHQIKNRIKRIKYNYTLDGLKNTESQCQIVHQKLLPLGIAISAQCTRPTDAEIEKSLGVKL